MSEQPTEYGKELIAAGVAAFEEGGDLDLDQMNPYYEQHLREAVRRILAAAIAKLKKPSEAMLKALHNQWPGGTGSDTTRWQCMLAQLLTEIGT